jgi:hypothetical protein
MTCLSLQSHASSHDYFENLLCWRRKFDFEGVRETTMWG